MRPVEHVLRDIDTIHKYTCILTEIGGNARRPPKDALTEVISGIQSEERDAFNAALNWYLTGMRSVFLQDANSLIIRPDGLVSILVYLRRCFPSVRRVTSYARSHTVAVRKEEDLQAIAEAGLNRIHIGMESGSDEVLAMMRKGVTKIQHIRAGLKVKQAGMELSEYFMPGLGGRRLSETHARESADALNMINPHFIRLRTLAIPNTTPLFRQWETGGFEKCTDLMVVQEILTFIDNLDGITSVIKSDHILNLLGELEGKLPDDKPRMVQLLRDFLAMDPERQMLYQVGRRLGAFSRLSELENLEKRALVEASCRRLGITPDNVDDMLSEVMKQFI